MPHALPRYENLRGAMVSDVVLADIVPQVRDESSSRNERDFGELGKFLNVGRCDRPISLRHNITDTHDNNTKMAPQVYLPTPIPPPPVYLPPPVQRPLPAFLPGTIFRDWAILENRQNIRLNATASTEVRRNTPISSSHTNLYISRSSSQQATTTEQAKKSSRTFSHAST